jgi:hypothetical protein
MTLPRLKALTEYWREHPPLHILVAGYFGIKSKREADADPDELMALIDQGALRR